MPLGGEYWTFADGRRCVLYCSGTVSLDEVGYGVRAVAVICQLEPHNLVHIAGRSLPSLNDNNYCLSLTMREHVLCLFILLPSELVLAYNMITWENYKVNSENKKV